jgi:hypothetical protein
MPGSVWPQLPGMFEISALHMLLPIQILVVRCKDNIKKSREAVVIFLFGLEALFTRASRTQSSVDLSLQQTLAAIGSYNDQTSFYFSSHFCVAQGQYCFVQMPSSAFSCTVFLYNTLSEISTQAVIPVIESKELANKGATRNTKQYIHSV